MKRGSRGNETRPLVETNDPDGVNRLFDGREKKSGGAFASFRFRLWIKKQRARGETRLKQRGRREETTGRGTVLKSRGSFEETQFQLLVNAVRP